MAATGITASSQKGDSEDAETEDHVWLEMMAKCLENSTNKLPHSKLLLVLGDGDGEKTLLVGKLQGTSDKLRKGNGLEYHFLNVRDEYCENQTKLGVWVLDEDPRLQSLLKYVLDQTTISETTVLLTASMAKPWNIFKSITTWAQILDEHIKNLDMPSSALEERKSNVLNRYREYIEPGLSVYGSLTGQEIGEPKEIENNLGVEIIVIITQTEHMTTLQTDFGYEDEHFDFIQYTLRKFCLSYGAALCYVSVKDDKNCDLLLKYILHKVYSFPFRIPAIFLEKDSVFVPAGWDSANKIRFLAETMTTIDALSAHFEDVIIKPGRLSANPWLPEIEADNDQDFLLALQGALLRQATDEASESAKENQAAAGVQRNATRRVSRSPNVRTSQKKSETKLTTVEGDTVLHTFFKSLLTRRTSAPVDRPVGTSGSRTYASKDPSEVHVNGLDNKCLKSSSSVDGSDSRSHEHPQDSENMRNYEVSNISSNENGKGETAHENELAPSSSLSAQHDLDTLVEDEGLESMSAFLRRCANSNASQGNKKFGNNINFPLDQDKDVHQLPEYFLSSRGSGTCAPDCCYQNNSSSANGDLESDFSLPLDRVRSEFNPPLRLILENPNLPLSQNVAFPVRKGTEFENSVQSSVVANSSTIPSTSKSLTETAILNDQKTLPSSKSTNSGFALVPPIAVKSLEKHKSVNEL
ncbi:cytoplasmic dynein 1 light intermediate chain 1-like isoform X2 [Stegodyphus dumicola]|nr:cytoplasmic dynein 1 light intermediate chain 1-like isoform X2 [Stegodyphus dumicola]XP_035210892.1 cytoplasmic dynein 1 light intermediate chain 1-like isoform X2 [Stegodyphus dumicola]XP_035210893.1 cytoplasmic dynein 1 light intermediate chain 1-like isoform X2 [Stegodyphus dumicola]